MYICGHTWRMSSLLCGFQGSTLGCRAWQQALLLAGLILLGQCSFFMYVRVMVCMNLSMWVYVCSCVYVNAPAHVCMHVCRSQSCLLQLILGQGDSLFLGLGLTDLARPASQQASEISLFLHGPQCKAYRHVPGGATFYAGPRDWHLC